ncbi:MULTISPECIES: hypothetical protein [unclassified Lentimicrobium]|uniref:hypothetical protein n=1 Tax=unclassified Lentimicrobium TaxID=2677434 RepID=UPI001553040A|nr:MULTISPECIES: hypothetical protein [unclassified Lentimicrobium]NPD44143.1 hypothetical protein [Lentimicrobium sp. S6]NPD83263.1 hypothetical protein [Lentimicrobium sp. L6]
MKNNWKLIILLLALSWNSFAQNVSVSSDTNAILIGEQVKLDLKYQLPANKLGLFPVFNDTITSLLEIVSRTNIDTIFTEDGQQLLQQQLVITSFDTGYHIIPPLPFGLMEKGDTTFQVLQSEPLLLNVFTVEVDTTKDIKPIVRPMAEPYTIAEFLPWIASAFAFGLVIFAIFYFIKRKKKNKPLFQKKEKPSLPPHEQAILDLEKLRLKKLWQQDQLKEYHTELIDIIRVYIEGRFGIQAAEMVSFEIMDSLKKENINTEALQKLQASLELSDLVKFAKSGASAIENDTSLNNCTDFVNETKQLIIKAVQEMKPTENKEVKDVQ